MKEIKRLLGLSTETPKRWCNDEVNPSIASIVNSIKDEVMKSKEALRDVRPNDAIIATERIEVLVDTMISLLNVSSGPELRKDKGEVVCR